MIKEPPTDEPSTNVNEPSVGEMESNVIPFRIRRKLPPFAYIRTVAAFESVFSLVEETTDEELHELYVNAARALFNAAWGIEKGNFSNSKTSREGDE